MTDHQLHRAMNLGAMLAAHERMTPHERAELATWESMNAPTSAWPGWTRLGVEAPAPANRPRPAKAKISPRLRRIVFERDGYTCQECGAHRDLTLDHVIPESRNGATDAANLRTLCRTCNSRKGAR